MTFVGLQTEVVVSDVAVNAALGGEVATTVWTRVRFVGGVTWESMVTLGVTPPKRLW